MLADESWAVVIAYEEDGYVSDEDAADFDYDELAIGDGNQAARQYQQALYGNVAVKERALIFNNLREYCRLDTMAMVAILSWAAPVFWAAAARAM